MHNNNLLINYLVVKKLVKAMRQNRITLFTGKSSIQNPRFNSFVFKKHQLIQFIKESYWFNHFVGFFYSVIPPKNEGNKLIIGGHSS